MCIALHPSFNQKLKRTKELVRVVEEAEEGKRRKKKKRLIDVR